MKMSEKSTTHLPYTTGAVYFPTTWPNRSGMQCRHIRAGPLQCHALRCTGGYFLHTALSAAQLGHWPQSSASVVVGLKPENISGHSAGCQSSTESSWRYCRWRSRFSRPRRQHTWATWSRRLFLFGYLVLQCYLFRERELNIFSRVAALQVRNSLPSDVMFCRTVQHLESRLFRQP